MSSLTDRQESPISAEPPSDRIVRMVAIGLSGGIAAGVLIAGIGSRLIMRILALVNDETAGLMTGNGNISGEITVGGTLRLIIAVGLVSGVIGGFVYVMIRRWLPGGRLLRGVAFGLVLLCFSGTTPPSLTPLFDPDNVDFSLFGPRQLSVGLFLLMILLFGIVTSFVVDHYDRYVPPLFTRPSITGFGYLLIAGLCAFGLFRTVPVINSIV